MYKLVLFFHVIIAIALVALILIQRGRSGGLVEALGGVESIFGTKTSSFLVKITVVLAICFFLTSLSLAYLSKQRGKSIMGRYQGTSDIADAEEEAPLAEEDLGRIDEPESKEAPEAQETQEPLIPTE